MSDPNYVRAWRIQNSRTTSCVVSVATLSLVLRDPARGAEELRKELGPLVAEAVGTIRHSWERQASGA